MKLLLMLIVAGSAAYFGYKHEPDLRPFITGIPQAARPSIPDSLRDIDLASLRVDQLPKEVTIFITRPYRHSNGNLEITILPGSKHAPVKISPPNVHLRVEGTKYQFVLPIDKTDLIQQLSQMPLDSAPDPTNTEPALPKPQSPSAQPTASPTPAPTAPSTATSTDAVMLMRDTLRNSPLKEFSISQITTWSAGPQETIDGESFATGIISYEAKTILGQKSMQAKALIKNGSIKKWIHAKSGIEIK
jgi:hypothetical protein